jgi:hypothetical protein
MNVTLFLTAKNNPASAEIPGIRKLGSGERIHLSEHGSVCHACLCDNPSAWTDRRSLWDERKDKCI